VVNRWLPTAAAQVHIQAACGVCGGQSGTGAECEARLLPQHSATVKNVWSYTSTSHTSVRCGAYKDKLIATSKTETNQSACKAF
jgi:hypothetical protein